MVSVGVRLHLRSRELYFRNPVVPASGTFGFGLEMADAFDLNILGGICLKGSTLEERYGNPCPRIAECPSGLLNSVGLQNPGVKVLAEEKIPALRRIYGGVVIANISGFSVEEYESSCAVAAPSADIVELNISCPNVHGGGMSFGTDPASAAKVTAAARKACGSTPLFVKLTPNVTDITAIARSCADAGADGLTLVNTFLGFRIDLKRRRPVLAASYGGYSGPGIFPIALRMVNQVHKACPSIPLMGCGGVSCARDVIEMMMAGASVVQIGSENLRNPLACKMIVEQLPSVMESLGIEDAGSIIGIV